MRIRVVAQIREHHDLTREIRTPVEALDLILLMSFSLWRLIAQVMSAELQAQALLKSPIQDIIINH